MTETKGVYCVIGMPYCGSTLLSALMGSHSMVYGGADLYHLNGERRGLCTLHKESCPIFTPSRLSRIYAAFDDLNHWYDEISDCTGKPYIFDASKQVSFSVERVLPELDAPLVAIALQKHPIRAIASDVYNRLFAKKLKIDDLSTAHKYIRDSSADFFDFVRARLSVMERDYDVRSEIREGLSDKDNFVAWVHLNYEDYVEDRNRTCRTLLEKFELPLEGDVDTYLQTDQHPITGNMGVIWKIRGGSGRRDYRDYRRAYYMTDESPIVRDDKYVDLFEERVIKEIESMPVYRKLLADTGLRPIVE